MTDAALKSVQPAVQADIESRLTHELQQLVLQPEQLLSITLTAPGIRFHHTPELPAPWFYYGQPDTGNCQLGLGIAHQISAAGKNRLLTLADNFDVVRQSWNRLREDKRLPDPSAFIAFSFAADDPMRGIWQGLPNACLFFPELLLRQQASESSLCFTAWITHTSNKHDILQRWQACLTQLMQALEYVPDYSGHMLAVKSITALPSEQEWLDLAHQATASIHHGELEKVVPCRRLHVELTQPYEPAKLLPVLERYYPSCTLFSLNLSNRLFVAATPERLIRRQANTITCDAIGGTMPRSKNAQQDQALANTLLNDPKLQHEHQLVVDGIRDALSPLCCELDIPDRPELIKLRHLQHLWSEVRGELKPGGSLLEIISRLHPTAAVNGMPKGAAHEWINKYETQSRGWYTGAAGWLDANGDGELTVLLRCALIDDTCAELFAGAGITAESDPEEELKETDLKLVAMLEALENA